MKLIKQTLIAIAVAASLTACGGGDEGSTTSTGSSASSTAPDFSNLQSCIANRWEMGAEQIKKASDTFIASTGEDASVTITGNRIFEFSASGTYKETPAYTAVATHSGFSATSQYAGTDSGTWSVDGDKLRLTLTSRGTTITYTIAGVTTTQATTNVPGEAKVISCTPATLTYELPLGTGEVVRIVLVRA